MSLSTFRAQNHPQQVAKRGALDPVDDRGTDPALFAALDARFGFTLDVAAAPHNAKCERYFTIDDDGLTQSWAGERVWCNPPYSDLAAWVDKAWEETYTCPVIVMLVPSNRTEQLWWQDGVEKYRDLDYTFEVVFLKGRRRFVMPGEEEIGPNQRPPFGSALLVWIRDPLPFDVRAMRLA